jgi:hypothetical protein
MLSTQKTHKSTFLILITERTNGSAMMLAGGYEKALRGLNDQTLMGDLPSRLEKDQKSGFHVKSYENQVGRGEDKRGRARYTPPGFASLVSAISRVPACRFLFFLDGWPVAWSGHFPNQGWRYKSHAQTNQHNPSANSVLMTSTLPPHLRRPLRADNLHDTRFVTARQPRQSVARS